MFDLEDWLTLLLIAALVVAVCLYQKKKEHTLKKEWIVRGLLVVYISFVLMSTLFARKPSTHVEIKWIPLWSWFEVIFHHTKGLFTEICQNLIMLIPVGAMLYILMRITALQAAWIGFLISAMVEITQLFARLGEFEWDDMIHNAIGCMIGAILAKKIIEWNTSRKEERGSTPMTDTERTLLQLTGRALFGASTDFDPAAVDWAEVYQEASNQALTLLVWDTLTKEERACVPKEISTRWEQNAFVHIMNNENLRYEQEQVLKALETAGIPCVILKGSSSAACYPKPELRIMGDIDLLVKPEEQMDAVKVLQAKGYGEVLEEDHHCHMTIHKDKFTVEVHREPNGLFVDAQSECAKKVKDYLDDAVEHRQMENGLPVLPDDMQALTLLIHKLEHFLTSGLGLRQLCDWAVFVDKRLDEKLWEELEPKLKEFGLLYFTGIMTKACVDYLGLPPESAPWATEYDSTTAGRVVEQILKEGNFGRKADRYGERLFANPNSSNRITSFFKVLFSACREHWAPCVKHPILLPVGPFVLLGRHISQRKQGKRPKLNLKKKYTQAGNDQKLYQSLRPFVSDSES